MKIEISFSFIIGSFALLGVSVQAAAPYAASQAATTITAPSATLNGMATPNGANSVAWFEWGTDASFGQLTAATNVGSGGSVVRVSAPISGLTFGEVYSFRLVVSNVAGIVHGAEQRFTTGRKVTAWGSRTLGKADVVRGLNTAVAIAAGGTHSVALRNDGGVGFWGFAFPWETNFLAGLSNVVAVTAGYGHSVALKGDGTLVAWGNNFYGQTNVPPTQGNVVAIDAGSDHTLALKADGTVVAWGNNSHGQTNVPTGLSNVVAVSGGDFHSLALKADGTVVAWGQNSRGQTNVPPGLVNVAAITAGGYYNIALRADGQFVPWGTDFWDAVTVPDGLVPVVAVSSGGNYHNVALRPDGTVAAWGNGTFGQTNVPAGLGGVAAISAGNVHNLALSLNVPPVAENATVSGFPNRDVVITLPVFEPNGDALSYRVTSLPSIGALFQYNGGVRGTPIAVPNTGVSNSQGRLIFAPANNGVGNAYASFGYVAGDGAVESAPAVVTINIVLPSAPRFTGAAPDTNGSFRVTFAGQTNAAYSVWASTNLVDWARLGPATTISPGVFQFTDVNANNWPHRFYRAIAP
jgi:alpha-tubulin suppressor-like RCC1 family protein